MSADPEKVRKVFHDARRREAAESLASYPIGEVPWWRAVAAFRDPELEIPRYLKRWVLSEHQQLGNVFLHFIQGDDLPYAHTHPWERFDSHILSGGYRQRVYFSLDGVEQDFGPYTAGQSHTWDWSLHTGHHLLDVQPDTWTLVRTGPKMARWGFYVPQGPGKAGRDFLTPEAFHALPEVRDRQPTPILRHGYQVED